MSTTATVEMQAVHCSCGGTYQLTAAYYKERQNQGGCWHCPYCSTSWGFPKGSSRLEKALATADNERRRRLRDQQWSDQEQARLKSLVRTKEAQRRAEKGAKTKAKQRHAAGVCPCCTRSFKQLRRHMASQHPEYSP